MHTQKLDHTVEAFSFRKLVLTIVVATVALIASSTVAHAQQAAADPGVRCAAKIGPGEYEFYLPGAKVTDVNGDKWVCGPDGQWFRDYSSLTTYPGTWVLSPKLVYTRPVASLVLR